MNEKLQLFAPGEDWKVSKEITQDQADLLKWVAERMGMVFAQHPSGKVFLRHKNEGKLPQKTTDLPKPTVTPATKVSGEMVAKEARLWVGHSFNPGVIEQCMMFVRNVLDKVNHPLERKVTSAPVDKHWTGPALASSLAGRDLGYAVVDKVRDLRPGSIVFFNDTYDVGPEFGPGTITHVGIYVGDGQMVHRPTAARPVELARVDSGHWLQHFRCGLVL